MSRFYRSFRSNRSFIKSSALLLFLGVGCGGRALPLGDGGLGEQGHHSGSDSTLSGDSAWLTGDGGSYCQSNAGCKSSEFCFIEKACAVTGAKLGRCTPRPAGCTADCPGVCGCDGKTYCNACCAHAAGTNVEKAGACSATDPLCKGVTCCLFDDCCTCTAMKIAIPIPACKVACTLPTCEAFGISNPFTYCTRGECLVSSKTKTCTSDADCYVYDDCCGCYALPLSIKPPPCAADCFVGRCASLGLSGLKPRCISGTCRLSE
jgi:hypothetical protein